MNKLLLFMMTAVSIFSCTNDYYPGLIENLGMKEQPLRIITKVLTTKSPNLCKNLQEDRSSGCMSSRKVPATYYDSIRITKNVRAEAFSG